MSDIRSERLAGVAALTPRAAHRAADHPPSRAPLMASGRAVASEPADQGATLSASWPQPQRAGARSPRSKAQSGNSKLKYYRADFESLAEVRDLAGRIAGRARSARRPTQQCSARDRPCAACYGTTGMSQRSRSTTLRRSCSATCSRPLLIASAPSRIVNVAVGGTGADQLRRHHARAKVTTERMPIARRSWPT